MRQAFYGILVTAVLFLTHCDRQRSVSDSTVTPPPTPTTPSTETNPTVESKVRLYLFAGGFCGPCKKELPAIQEWLNTKMATKKNRILPLLVFTAGNPANVVATQPDAETFKKDLGLEFETIADPRGKNIYRKYYAEGSTVPATVLLKENLEVIKIYPRVPVDTEVLLSTFEADINEALK